MKSLCSKRTYLMPAKGFTLIEMVAVIIILSIVSLGVTNLIGTSTQIFLDATERDEILAKSRYTVERLNRAIRYALPNSIRVKAHEINNEVNTHCLEYFPIEWSTFYLDIAVGKDDPISVIQGPNMVSALSTGGDFSDYDRTEADNHFIVVYPTDPDQIYVSEAELTDDEGRIVGLKEIRDSATSGLVEAEFDNAIAFDEESTVDRFYIVGEPISYCMVFEKQVDGEPRYNLYLVSDYGIHEDQIADIDELTNIVNNGSKVLMAEDLSNDIRLIDDQELKKDNRDFDASPFRVSDTKLQANSIIHTLLMFERNDEVVVFNNEIHLRNTP